jgi:hypothetical protein
LQWVTAPFADVANAVMTSRTQGWSGRAGDASVDDRDSGLQRRDGVQCTPTVLTTLHQVNVLESGPALVATPQQEMIGV